MLKTRIEKIEQRATPPALSDRDWRETLNRISKVYGDGSPVEGDTPRPTRAELGKIIDDVYST